MTSTLDGCKADSDDGMYAWSGTFSLFGMPLLFMMWMSLLSNISLTNLSCNYQHE
jgi:hypothetical protein